MQDDDHFGSLLREVRACKVCEPHLPLGCRPVVQLHPQARILITGQAPGRRVHETGIPFNDPSGERLRQWMGVGKDVFYDAKQIAILPMGFCYPGSSKTGDLPPRKECAETWRDQVMAQLAHVELTIILGKYARDWHLPEYKNKSLTETVLSWEKYGPALVVLPHPSPRNIRWFKTNPWFEQEVAPKIKARVAQLTTQQ
ncbi:MAG: uracil-DNA glycosylase family protein [Methylophilaceae bacterium]